MHWQHLFVVFNTAMYFGALASRGKGKGARLAIVSTRLGGGVGGRPAGR